MTRPLLKTMVPEASLIASSMVESSTQAAPIYRATAPQDPITKFAGMASTAEFTGDEPDPNHERFWNVDGYHLKKLKPLILEQASQFGGNSKGEAINSSCYSLGPAYISIPEANSASHRMLNDIGVLKCARLETAVDKEVFLNGKVLPNFWSGQHEDAKVFAQKKQLLKGFESNPSNFNSMTVNQWIQRNFPQITTTLYQYFQYYAWSSFGPTQMRTKSAVLKVMPGNGFVDVVVEESLNKLKTIRTIYVVMAAPKFVEKRSPKDAFGGHTVH